MENTRNFSYSNVFSRLSYETAIITFIKKDGTIRFMIGTRNIKTASLKYDFLGQKLGGYDKRCNIQNGNVAVIDLILGEPRTFNINRVCDVKFLGEITDGKILDDKIDEFVEYRDKCQESLKADDIFNNIETGGQQE